ERAHAVHEGAARRDPAADDAAAFAADRHRRPPAGPLGAAGRLRVRAALPAGHRAVRGRTAAARRTRARAPLRVLAPARAERAPRDGRGRSRGDGRRSARRRRSAVTTVQPAPPRADEPTHVPLLEVRNLVQEYVSRGPGGVKAGVVHAVSDISLELDVGQTLGIVGETGSGKSTLARAIIQVERPKSGQVLFQGQDIVGLPKRRLRAVHADIQMVYQDPFGSLNPRWRVEDVVAEPLLGHTSMRRAERRARGRELLDLVGLDPDVYLRRRPLELSGG